MTKDFKFNIFLDLDNILYIYSIKLGKNISF